MWRVSLFLLCLIFASVASAEDHTVTIITVEPPATERSFREPDVDFSWIEREINRTWVFVRSLLAADEMRPPRVSFDYVPRDISPNPRRASLEAYSPEEKPPTVHISWDIFRINDNPRRMKISGYVEWAVGHGFMHHILTEQSVPPESQHCAMLERGYAKSLLSWLDSLYHTPGQILTQRGMHEIRIRCSQERAEEFKKKQ